MIWLTSDWHIDHVNIIEHCQRPFAGIADMNGALITNHNQLVHPQDTVLFLGDLCWNKRAVATLLNQLNGKFWMIWGNHDKKMRGVIESHPKVVKMSPLETFKQDGRAFVLCHYPIENWENQRHGNVHFHGHSHGASRAVCNRLDVGVDCWHYRPIRLEDAIAAAEER